MAGFAREGQWQILESLSGDQERLGIVADDKFWSCFYKVKEASQQPNIENSGDQ